MDTRNQTASRKRQNLITPQMITPAKALKTSGAPAQAFKRSCSICLEPKTQIISITCCVNSYCATCINDLHKHNIFKCPNCQIPLSFKNREAMANLAGLNSWLFRSESKIFSSIDSGKTISHKHLSTVSNAIDANAKNTAGNTFLVELCSLHDFNETVFNTLLEAGANPNIISSEGFTILSLLMDYDDFPKLAFERTLKNGADPNKRNVAEDKCTPLEKAVSDDNLKAVELLFEYGANPEMKNSFGENLLHLAESPAVANKLLSLGKLDIEERCNEGYTVFLAMAAEYQSHMLRYWYNHKADINAVDNNGLNILSILAKSRNIKDEEKADLENCCDIALELPLKTPQIGKALRQALKARNNIFIECALNKSSTNSHYRADIETELKDPSFLQDIKDSYPWMADQLLKHGYDPA
ncbi:ankyrin repeat domain-containing protein [Sansalvadorimonas sp. 2012CJ34-2]|uniref:Ankyrin repeat domain-containing protein n=1 Tax=Parendozoicomonas callyspongiae TaxID=2942213 RepID=A0ABT0PBI0_9GAMM|nr:ankyrin repeat domain-containing protein [Sansalvadorimonas sp. 2012CJ34-2]MCL6268643.1 ankyrin repeat domain-containing protein [Sansalvadorimonas sp. 2012CJ34-2]